MNLKSFLKYLFLFSCGGFLYIIIEVLYRGYSHWTMFLLGGLCFVLLGLINEILSWSVPLLLQMFLGSCIVTSLEFITGCIVNLLFHWNIWDYSTMPGNILGQICPQFSLLWMFLSLFGIILDDYLRYWFFNEEKPQYLL